jgi:hypothetical protein
MANRAEERFGAEPQIWLPHKAVSSAAPNPILEGAHEACPEQRRRDAKAKEKNLLTSPNLACFASLRESPFLRFRYFKNFGFVDELLSK